MGERSSYEPGTFCWVELTTPEQDAAKEFYSGLFGWQARDMPVGEGAVYSIMELHGADAAAISFQPRAQRDAGVPPMWNSYVSVASADEAAARAGQLGAEVHAAPFDVMDVGRMAVIQDPQGAFFEIWEPRERAGAAIVNQPGAFTWSELSSPDPHASAGFYGELFGWANRSSETGIGEYLGLALGDASVGGIRGLIPPQAPPHWLVYFGCEDVEHTMARVRELGGTTPAGPIAIATGAIAFAVDPQGAGFGLYAGDYDA